MSRWMNLQGKRYGELYVIQKVNSSTRRPNWRCECDCGTRLTVGHDRLIHKMNPKTHCGCARKGLPTLHKVEYHAWWDMRQRCHNEAHHGYSRYGAKGVQVCDRWYNSFEAFLEDMGPRPPKLSLDRIDPTGNYEPTNCR